MLMGDPLPLFAADKQPVKVLPESISLSRPEASEQMLVLREAQGRNAMRDITREATYRVRNPTIAEVLPSGLVIPRGDGETEIAISFEESMSTVPLTVRGIANPPPVSFEDEILPVLTKAGCNSGGCHGKAEGQQGFKLSVFGFDPKSDYESLVLEGRGRRIFAAVPERSLLRMKGTSLMPHGGGRRIEPGAAWDQLILRWIREGARRSADAEKSAGLDQAAITEWVRVEPAEVTMTGESQQQLRVILERSNGQSECVTRSAQFESNNDTVATVDPAGLITTTAVPGEAAILVRYRGNVGLCRVNRPAPAITFVRPMERNFIDRLVWDKLQQLHIQPSPVAEDAVFLRRVYLDTIGTLPTAQEVEQFLGDGGPGKRARTIDALLERTEYVDYWTQKWSDLLQIDKDTIAPQSAVAMTRWVRRQVQRNLPYDEFVTAILTAEGSLLDESPAPFFQVQGDAEKAARATSQLFLGVRLECAQCHHHPQEKWDQRDYVAFAGFFTGIERKPAPLGSTKIVSSSGTDLTHPRTGNPVPAAALGEPPAVFSDGVDRRNYLAQWVTRPGNPFFARLIVNRLWGHYFGRGLVEPIDDLRDTNPASNEPLLEALAEHLINQRFDLKALTRTILNSSVYQLDAEPNVTNRMDTQNFSHSLWRPLPAEVLLDAVSQATGIPEQFNGWPQGYRAIEVWDNKLPSHFLEVFGRPRRLSVCACERGTEPSMAQALHLMNSLATTEKIEHRFGRAAELAQTGYADREVADREVADREVIDQLYLTTLSRYPTPMEQDQMVRVLAAAAMRREAVEDILWTLLNTREFIFNH